ncbi:MAG: hypothetical protein GSR86_00550 [Desulfurococcales archaeon]|nr:hypothetical protein [Desulfurococcales archaeon]
MSETIRVKKSIYDILVRIAREQGMSTPEKVLEELVLEKAGIPRDMFGIDRGRVKPTQRRIGWRIGDKRFAYI